MLLFTFVPVTFAVLGATVAVRKRPGPTVRSAVQHFAAGVVFAAAAGELLPDLLHRDSPWSTVVGGFAGIVVVLLVRTLGRRAKGSVSLLATTGVDIFIDGLVLGIGFAAGRKQGLLLTTALSIEILFLGLSVSSVLGAKGASGTKTVATTGALALLLPAGAAIGQPLAASSALVLNGLFAFGLIAWLYLVTEELLVEAHKARETPVTAAMFFVGFLVLVLLEEMMA